MRKAMADLVYTTTNSQTTIEKYSGTYSKDFFTLKFFTFSALGTGAAPKALEGVGLPAKGEVYPGVALDPGAKD